MPLHDPQEYQTRRRGLYMPINRPPYQLYILPSLIKSRYEYKDRPHPAWCSAARPFGEETAFAVGLDNGKVSKISEGEGTYSRIDSLGRGGQAVLTIDWVDHDTIISGGRGENVCLWDTRSRGESMRFRHPSHVNHVRRLEGTRVAVAGNKNSVSHFFF